MDNQKPQVEERQDNNQKFENTKWIIRSPKSKKVRQYNKQKFENTKWITRIHKSKKNRQYNDQTKKDKRTNNDLQNIHMT